MTLIRSVLPDIVRYTNLEARRQIQRSEWLKSVWQETTETEILAFLGIHLLCGAYKAHYRDIKEIFSERDGIPAVYCTMSLQRFACIRRLIRFDDRLRRNPDDPFGPVRDIWTSIINEFRRVYKPSSTVTIDEQLVEFHGRVKFRMYIPSKPGKYGIKIIWLVDNSNTFVLNGLIYIGRQTLNEEEYPGYSHSENVTLKVVEPYFGTGINVTGDNWFTSCKLVNRLKRESLSYVGTVKHNRREIPASAKCKDGRAMNSAKYYSSDDMMLLSYMDKKTKPVLLLSSLHRLALQGEKKPEVIEYYNATKSGVDNMDHMVRFYSCKRKTRRWSYSFFMNLVDIMALNAHILYNTDHPQQTRYEFLKNLAHQLLIPMMQERQIANPRLPRSLSSKMRLFIPGQSTTAGASSSSNSTNTRKRKRCGKCPTAADKKTDIVCSLCGEYLCLAHRCIVCSQCINV